MRRVRCVLFVAKQFFHKCPRRFWYRLPDVILAAWRVRLD